MSTFRIDEMGNHPKSRLPVIEIYPGGFYISNNPTIISTVLGSCVSICFYVKNKGIGAMCHCVLPEGKPDTPAERFRFVKTTIQEMLDLMRDKGVNKTEIQAMLFGGARTLAEHNYAVGIRNVAMAQKMLKKNNIPIIAENTGGIIGRKVHFNTKTGEIFLRKINSKHIRQFKYAEKMDALADEMRERQSA